jgi:hypothetical protein
MQGMASVAEFWSVGLGPLLGAALALGLGLGLASIVAIGFAIGGEPLTLGVVLTWAAWCAAAVYATALLAVLL